MEFNLLKVANAVAMPVSSINAEVDEFRVSHPRFSREKLAKEFSKKIIRNYTSLGVATALPSVIPGIGTAAQLAIEGGTITGDLAIMLRWMHKLCYGVGIIYGRDMSLEGNQDFLKILGLWSGVIKAAQPAVRKVAEKVAIAQFNKRVSGKLLSKINQYVGAQILTKYGSKRGIIAIGKLIPFGIGAGVSGGFNNLTMRAFANSAISYYSSDEENIQYEIIE